MKTSHKITLGSITAVLAMLITFVELTKTTVDAISQFTTPKSQPDTIKSIDKGRVGYENNFMENKPSGKAQVANKGKKAKVNNAG